MQSPFQMMLAYGVCLAAASAGLAGAPIWAAPIAGVALAVVAIRNQLKLRFRFEVIGAREVLATAHLASLAEGCIAASIAWLFGALIRSALTAL